MASLALFDLAGTLVDPMPGLIASHRFVLNEIGLDFDALTEAKALDVSQLVRAPVPEIYQRLGVPTDHVPEAVQEFKQRSVLAGWLEDQLFDGVDELLVALIDNGWTLGVVTNQIQRIAERTLDNINILDRFKIVAGNAAPRGDKDITSIVTDEIAKLDAKPDGIAVIGDRGMDIELAKELGATSIGAAWGFGSIEELMGADADAVAMTPADVVELLIGDA